MDGFGLALGEIVCVISICPPQVKPQCMLLHWNHSDFKIACSSLLDRIAKAEKQCGHLNCRFEAILAQWL
jgi:hypothetical protein